LEEPGSSLRSKLPSFLAADSRFRISHPWTILGFLLPFIHLPSLTSLIPLSDGPLALHLMLAVLKLVSNSPMLALTVALPLFMAGTSCLSQTSPSNDLGGRLGSLTDLSLLRLLNSLDPSPGSRVTSTQLHLRPYVRALPSTVAPAVDSARTRLIVLLAIIAVLGCGRGLFVIFRTYDAFLRYQKRFKEEICRGMEMVLIPYTSAPAWYGLSEEGIKAWITRRIQPVPTASFEVMGVFGIP
jgi:hypothetical protein